MLPRIIAGVQLIPWGDLNAQGTIERKLALPDDIAPVLAINSGFDGQIGRLLRLDGSGRLVPSLSTGPATIAPAAASQANLAALSAAGAALVEVAGQWALSSAPAAGAAASASRSAAAAGVSHVAAGVAFGFSSQAALAGVSTVTFNLRDGAAGVGTVLQSWTFDLPAAIIVPFAVAFSALNMPGSLATAMTLETAAAVAGLRVFCNLSGYDAS